MSILQEIHNQPPVVRRVLFVLSVVLSVSGVAFITLSSIQKDIYFATHQDPKDQQDFIARRDAGRPQPLAAVARVTGALVGSIGSLIGWNSSAGFDRVEQPSNTQDGVHLLPLSQ